MEEKSLMSECLLLGINLRQKPEEYSKRRLSSTNSPQEWDSTLLGSYQIKLNEYILNLSYILPDRWLVSNSNLEIQINQSNGPSNQ